MANFDATPQLRVLKKFMDAFLSRDMRSVQPLIAKNYVFQTFPKGVEQSDENKEAHLQRWGKILAIITKIEASIHEVIEAPGKVVAHATATLYIGDTKIDYDTVCILTFTEEDGELKILGAKNFADPQKIGAVYTAVAQLQAKGELAA